MEHEITLHTTHCPKCIVLEKKLIAAGIPYKKNTDIQLIIDKGFMEAPLLEVDSDVFLVFMDAIKWIQAREG